MKRSEVKQLFKECIREVLKEDYPNGLVGLSENSNTMSVPMKDPTVVVQKQESVANAAKLAATMTKGNAKEKQAWAQVMGEAAARTGDKIHQFEKEGGVPPEVGAVDTNVFEKFGAKPQNWMKLALSNNK